MIPISRFFFDRDSSFKFFRMFEMQMISYSFIISSLFIIIWRLNSCYFALKLSPRKSIIYTARTYSRHNVKHLFISDIANENPSKRKITAISSSTVSSIHNPKKFSNYSNTISQTAKNVDEGWFLELSNSVMLKIPVSMNNPLRKETSRKSKSSNIFASINRVDGRKKWINEIKQYHNSLQNASIPLLCALSKELLYSGSPEQSVELFLSLLVIFGHADSYEFFRLNVLTVRALIRLGKLSEAISLLKYSYSRYNVDEVDISLRESSFSSMTIDRQILSRKDADLIRDLSEAIAELAVLSKQGLQEALALRNAMIVRGHAPLLGIGSAGLLKGLRLHFLDSRSTPPGTQSNSPLLGISDFNRSSTTAEFSLTHEEVETLAHQIAAPHLSKFSSPPEFQTNNTRRAQRVIAELVRVLFRTAAAESSYIKRQVDMNFQTVSGMDGQQRTIQGLSSVLTTMSEYQLQWDTQLAEILLDECLRVGGTDIAGISQVVRSMWEHGIHATTATFNALLRRYAESGDSESSYNLLTGVMMASAGTYPNEESWSLVLTSCLQSRKGLFYATEVYNTFFGPKSTISEMDVSKDMWDQFLQLKILSKESPLEFLSKIVQSRHQPDAVTMRKMYSSYSQIGDLEGMLSLYYMQRNGLIEHQTFSSGDERLRQRMGLVWGSSQNISYSNLLASMSRLDENQLPQGTTKYDVLKKILQPSLPAPCPESTRILFELLKQKCEYRKAYDILEDLLLRTKRSNINVEMQNTDDILLHLRDAIDSSRFVVDQTIFSLAIETCVDASRLEMALELVRKMEIQLDLSPDRRIYSSLIRAFGKHGDVSSALGVFQEMRKLGNYVPDVMTLDSLLEICFRNPSDLRHICPVLEDMAEDAAIDLEIYSKDILMQGFSDGFKLGSALMSMERQQHPEIAIMTVSFPVLTVLAQAARSRADVLPLTSKAATLEEVLIAALQFLGSFAIHPDAGTMEYFRIPNLPTKGSPNSRHYVQSLVPNREKVRSLMDLEMPGEFKPDISITGTFEKIKQVEPYFESGENNWLEHSLLIQSAVRGDQLPGRLESSPLFEIQGVSLHSMLASSASSQDDESDAELLKEFPDRGVVALLEEPLEIKEQFLRQANPAQAVKAQQVSVRATQRESSVPKVGPNPAIAPPKVVYKIKGVARDKVLADEARAKKKLKQQKQQATTNQLSRGGKHKSGNSKAGSGSPTAVKPA